MYQERFDTPHKLGVVKHTNGDNAGLFYANERVEKDTDVETGEEKTVYVYDVYEIDDCRDPHKVKNEVINAEHPYGDETKILRKTLARLLKETGRYEDFAEFAAYNDFVEGIKA